MYLFPMAVAELQMQLNAEQERFFGSREIGGKMARTALILYTMSIDVQWQAGRLACSLEDDISLLILVVTQPNKDDISLQADFTIDQVKSTLK